jgi:hypothetical protein
MHTRDSISSSPLHALVAILLRRGSLREDAAGRAEWPMLLEPVVPDALEESVGGELGVLVDVDERFLGQ